MNNYNNQLISLRENLNLSLREAAKGMGLPFWKLYLYENGYFRPNKKAREKINAFYKTELSISGDDAYPAPVKEKALSVTKENLLVKRLIFGCLSILVLSSVLTGGILFNKSVNNTSSYYGETYNQLKKKVSENGDTGYDLVTSLKYHYVSGQQTPNDDSTIMFYETDNILYFNECTYSKTVTKLVDGTFGIDRYRYQFGFNLGVNSYRGEFTYGSVLDGAYFTCSFDYHGGPVEKIYDLKNLISGTDIVEENEAIEILNYQIGDLDKAFSSLISKQLDKEVDFYQDFLHDRELGRRRNFTLQITGLLLIIPGIVAFYIFFGIFVKLMFKNVKPRLVNYSNKKNDQKNVPLPDDISVNIGIPDMFVVLIAKILSYGSIVLMLVALIAKLGVPFLSFFSHPFLLTIFRLSLLAGIFLEHFVMIGRIKKPTTLFQVIIYNLGIFLFVATMETVVIAITNAWGYDFSALIYKYIPSNVFQVVAVHYLIFLFLFFQPSFLKDRKKIVRIIWHSLSFIPLGFLIATYFLSNAYALVYGVQENIYLNFWFPNGFLSLSIVCVLFLYSTFAIRLYFERKYGSHNGQVFFFGDRYNLIENIICAGLIILAASFDFIFANNQYAYYLGLGSNYWLFFLVPFILLCKYSPNNQQIFLVYEQYKTYRRASKTSK